MAYLKIRWENIETRRYYLCVLEYDLFGELLLTAVYGGINSANGQIKKNAVSSIEQAMSKIQKIDKTRKRHGYRLISTISTFDHVNHKITMTLE